MMNKYIKLLEDFDPETDLTPILPVEEKHGSEEPEEDAELDVVSMTNSEGTEQWFVVDVNKKKGVAGPFVQKSDAHREIEVMQGKPVDKEEDHGDDQVAIEIREENSDFDPTDLIFMAAQYTEEDLEPLAGQMWPDPNDLVSHILGSIESDEDKKQFLTDAKEEYPEITITI